VASRVLHVHSTELITQNIYEVTQ